MVQNSFPGLDFGLGSRHRHAARHGAGLCPEQDRAVRGRDRPLQQLSARAVAAARRSRALRRHGRGGMGRGRARLPRPLRRHGGDFARLRRGRAVLRRAFEPVRQPDPPQRQRRPAAPLFAQADFRRACRRAGDVGVRLRLRRGVDAHPRRPQGRPLHSQRLENVDHQRAGRRHAGGLCQDRPHGRRPRHHRVPGREDVCRVFRRAKSSTSSACAAPTPARSCFRTARCRKEMCSASSATASTF